MITSLAPPRKRIPVKANGHPPSFTQSSTLFFDGLKKHISHLEDSLAPDEILLVFYHRPNGEKFIVHNFEYKAPNLIALRGHNHTGKQCYILVNEASLRLTYQKIKVSEAD